MVIKETRSDKIFNFINYFLLACVFLICLYPLWFIIIASISNPDLVNGGQVWFWPKDISFDGYKSLFADDGVMRGYVNTLIYTTGGTLINLAVTLPAAYALSRRDFVGRKFFTLMFLFTMFFSGGLIPTFLTVKSLGLYNNPWVMVILGATSMTNIIISRSFFETNIPNELREAAEIDGCSNTRFFFSIVLPLSTAIIAVMALFFAVMGAVWGGFTQLGVFAGAMFGGLLGFLYYNRYPAKVFMGDTGSLFLGGAVAGLAFECEMPLILLLVGLIYIIETLSVILQVTYFKATHGKRLFKMAPIHHHFEMCGWGEKKIVLVFTGITVVLCLLAYHVALAPLF